MKRLLHITAVLLIGFTACSPQEQVGKSQLVVEGWIENGEHPIVMVSESIGIATGRKMDTKSMLDHVAKWAKVSISDGTTTEYLTGIPDPEYFPPYIFTTSKITGEVGKSYTLKVEYKDYKLEATTVIPEPVPIDRVYVQSATDSIASLRVCFTDPPQPGHFYKVFTRTEGKDSHYHPSALTNISDQSVSGYSEIMVYSTQRLMDFIDWPNIRVGDVVWIKLCTTDRITYEYWNNYEITIASNGLGTFYESDIESNMDGALGYWAGYGVDKEVKFTVTKPNE